MHLDNPCIERGDVVLLDRTLRTKWRVENCEGTLSRQPPQYLHRCSAERSRPGEILAWSVEDVPQRLLDVILRDQSCS